jgi:hypothetical protein
MPGNLVYDVCILLGELSPENLRFAGSGENTSYTLINACIIQINNIL